MYFDDFEKDEVLSSVFLPFVSEVRCLMSGPGEVKAKCRLAEKALAYLDVLEPAFERKGGLSVRRRQAVCKFRTSEHSGWYAETELDEVLSETSQQIEAMVLLMGTSPRRTDG